MFMVPCDVEACGKSGPPFSSLSTCKAGQHEVDGSLMDSTKTLEPGCNVLSEQLAENAGDVFLGRRDG
jgi:hypothetical protein